MALKTARVLVKKMRKSHPQVCEHSTPGLGLASGARSQRRMPAAATLAKLRARAYRHLFPAKRLHPQTPPLLRSKQREFQPGIIAFPAASLLI